MLRIQMVSNPVILTFEAGMTDFAGKHSDFVAHACKTVVRC